MDLNRGKYAFKRSKRNLWIAQWTVGLVPNIYKGSFANLAAKEYLSSRAVGLDLNGRDRSGGERESMAAGIGPAARHPRRCHGKAHRSSRFLAYQARFDSPMTQGERGGGGKLTGTERSEHGTTEAARRSMRRRWLSSSRRH